MLEWKKGQIETDSQTKSYINEMEEAMDGICKMLSEESKEFDAKGFFETVNDYIVNKDRLIYTNITNYIFTLNDQQFGILQTNMDKVVNYVYSEKFSLDYPTNVKKEILIYDRTKRTILKMWDHVNLARRQYLQFSQNSGVYQKIVDDKMEKAEAKISKEMNGQLIALVSIFTALSFLIFGGIGSLDNILAGAQDIPILKLLIVGNIWCLCMMNLIFVFMFFIAKLTNLNIKSTENVNANFVQKYPFVWWCDWVLCSSGIIFGWIYYLKRRQLLCAIEETFFKNRTCFVIIISALIGVLIIGTGCKIFSINKKEKTGRKRGSS